MTTDLLCKSLHACVSVCACVIVWCVCVSLRVFCQNFLFQHLGSPEWQAPEIWDSKKKKYIIRLKTSIHKELHTCYIQYENESSLENIYINNEYK